MKRFLDYTLTLWMWLLIAIALSLGIWSMGCIPAPWSAPPPEMMADRDHDGAPDIDDIDPDDPRIGRTAPPRTEPIRYNPYAKPDA